MQGLARYRFTFPCAFSLIGRAGQQGAGIVERGLRHFLARKHIGKLGHAFLGSKADYVTLGCAVRVLLVDLVMPRAESGYLREVGDANHLAAV